MADQPAAAQELDRFRAEADRFIAELTEEEYRHYAGLKERLELEPIYERHADVGSLEWAKRIGAAANGDRRTRELWRFASERYLAQLTRAHDEQIAAAETELTAEVDGERMPFRMLHPAIANEPDRERRRRLAEARNELTEEHLNPTALEAARIAHGAVAALGAPTYVELYRRFGFRLDELAAQCEAVLDETGGLYERAFDRVLRKRVGVGLDDAERWDVARCLRATEWDPAFPASGMVPALEGTLRDLGIDLRAQSNVELDLEQRPTKTPRAFCAPIEVPDRVVLVVLPIGGADDWVVLFHEAGHTEHFAHASPELAVEDRRLGDHAVTEGWAALFEGLVGDAGWLSRRLDVPRPHDFAAESAALDLLRLRFGCARLLYELEFHATREPGPELATTFVERHRDALRISPSPADYLSVDPGFYMTAYLRSWAFAAQLRLFLREEFGTAWFARREAGSLLHDLWSEGQRLSADELLKDVAGMTLDLTAEAERLQEALR
jgi:hypothetical protein